jgi:primosomal replication protein N
MDLKNNNVTIAGKIVVGFTFENEVCGEKFYMTDVLVYRNSGTYDLIPFMVSERFIDVGKDYRDCYILANGQFRSYNRHDGDKSKLVLYVFARDVSISEDDCEEYELNTVSLKGYICKEPKYRKTPLGREITDLLLAVNRPYGKSDYIPCICWGRNARYVSNLETGTCLKVSGRIQSREYEKKLADGTKDVRTTYEVSVSKIEVVEGEE